MTKANSTEFVRKLLSADPALSSTEFAEKRRLLLDRLAQAERMERRGRIVTIAISVITLIAYCSLYAAAVNKVGEAVSWPEWAQMITAITMILLPIASILLFGLYFVRHRRELLRTREHLQQAALEGMPQKVADLTREIEELRKELQQIKGAGTITRQSPTQSGESGFTLMEMMTVVVMLGILASLLFPALAKAKSRTRIAQCANNLYQMSRAMVMYEDEQRGYPGAGPVAVRVNDVFVPAPDSWNTLLLPYIGNDVRIYSCPGYRTSRKGYYSMNAYGYNASGSCDRWDWLRNLGLGAGSTNPIVSSAQVRVPSDMVALGDLDLPPSVWDNVITPNLKSPIGVDSWFIAARHKKGANMVFLDGHVELKTLDQWREPTDSARRRWNNDHEPHPETW